MAGVVAGGATMMGLYEFVQREVLTDPQCVDPEREKNRKKSKPKLTMKESAAFLVKSTYIRDLALLVIGYGMSINIVEVTWKSKLKAAFPDPNAYSAFMGNFSSATGAVTLIFMLVTYPPLTLSSTPTPPGAARTRRGGGAGQRQRAHPMDVVARPGAGRRGGRAGETT